MQNKKLIICLSIFLILVIGILLILFLSKNETKFYLETNYYEKSNMTEIKTQELNQLINDRESFALFVYQPMCITSSDFESILYDFLEENHISIYKIAFSNIKDTDLGKIIEYYPSFIIYNKGKIVDFLEANKDEDVNYYTSKEGFKKWFTTFVKLKDNTSNENNSFTDEPVKDETNIKKDVVLENVVRESNKINIYFFWGNGCPHCEEEFEFFESIKDKYGQYYNLYTFETWYNEENAKLIYTFADAMGDKVTGVPYTIIGDKSFTGFGENSKESFIKEIEKNHKNSNDIYFDKIKK